jgi:homoserine kinase type II
VITEPALVSWLSRYWGLAGARVTEHNGGMGSETWFVDRGDQRWVAKAVAPGGGGQFAGGLAIARRPEQAGIPAGAPVPAGDGPALPPMTEEALSRQFERGLAALLDGLAVRMNIG